MSVIISPPKIYEVNGEVCELKTKSFTALASTSNQSAVASVSGKKLRLMGFTAQTSGAANALIVFRDGSGGTAYDVVYAPQSTEPPYALPVIDAGYWSTTVSTGIFVDNSVATNAILIIRYIEHT